MNASQNNIRRAILKFSYTCVLGAFSAGVYAAPAATVTSAQAAYPDRPITLVVAFSAGGAADVVMRKFGVGLSAILGVAVVVENRAGANGNIGANYVAKAKPDGYTLLAGFPGLTSNPSIYPNMSYDPLKDLTPIKMVATAPVLLVTNPKFEPKTVTELITYAKAKPGAVRYGSAGTGSSGHLAGELFKLTAAVKLEHIPYKGGANALNDLMGGQIEVIFDSVPSSRPLVEGSKIRAIAIAGEQRSKALPNVPTFSEAGLPSYYAGTWFAVLAPAGTPNPIVTKLSNAISKLSSDQNFQNQLAQSGLEADKTSTADFVKFMTEETQKWKRVVDVAGVKAN